MKYLTLVCYKPCRYGEDLEVNSDIILKNKVSFKPDNIWSQKARSLILKVLL